MLSTKALIVGNSRVERAALQSALEPVEGLKVSYSLRGGQRVLDRLSTGDIEVLFVLMSEQDALDEAFLAELGRFLCSGVTVIPVCTFSKSECLRRFQAARIRTAHYHMMPRNEGEVERFVQDVCRTLDRPRVPTRKLPALRGPEKSEFICIVSSTGGPEALAELLSGIGERLTTPILITQHMPEGFVDTLCQNLSKHARRPVVRASEGCAIEPGGIYVAPGGAHLAVKRRNDGYCCTLDQGPPSAGCKPAGNVMLESAVKVCAGRLVAVCLTGMGEDGTQGMALVRASGGKVIVQDEASSVVWGMPGSIVRAGHANHILPLSKIAAKVMQLAALKVGGHVSRAS